MCVYHPVELEEMTKTTLLLLPNTYGREMDTIDAATLLAASHHAAFVPLFDSYASGERKGVRQKHFQQSKMERRMAMRYCELSLISLPAQESSWISRLCERISHFRPGHRQCADQQMPRKPALRERVGQEVAALTGHAEVPDLERESTARRRRLD